MRTTRYIKTTYYIPQDLIAQTKAEATRQYKTTSQVVRDAIAAYLAGTQTPCVGLGNPSVGGVIL